MIIGANNARRNLILDNQSNQSVCIGPDAAIAAGQAISLRPNNLLTLDSGAWNGSIYGVVAAGSASVAYWENTF